MDPNERRDILQPLANPGSGRDYVVTLRGKLDLNGRQGPLSVIVRYVPDRSVLEPANFDGYLAAIGPQAWETLESIAVAISDDISNQLIPRWSQATLREHDPSSGAACGHDICIEEHQPGWHNEDLLYRLPPV